MTDDDKTGDKNNDDPNNLLFELYQTNSNTFQKVFVTLLGFALIFLFVIFFPYVSTLEKSREIDRQIRDLQQEIWNLQLADNGTQSLQRVLKYSPDEVSNEALGLVVKANQIKSNTFSTEVDKMILDNYMVHKENMPILNKYLIDFFRDLNNNVYIYLDHGFSPPNVDSIVKSLKRQPNIHCDRFKVNPVARDDCNLNNKIQSLSNSFLQNITQLYHINNTYSTYSNCNKFPISRDEWNDCNLNNKIQSLSNTYSQILNQKIVTPVQHSRSQALIDTTTSLQKAFQNQTEVNKINHHFFASLLNSNPSMFFQKVAEAATELSRSYNSTLKPIHIALTHQISQDQIINDTKHKELQSSNKDKNEIQARLNQTQFPFGKLPLNLDQTVLAFPIALAIGFVVCISLQRSAIHLRKELDNWYRKKYPQRTIKVDIIAPLWIDPLNSKLNKITKFSILVIPFFIFILAWCIISFYLFSGQGNQNIPNNFTGYDISIYSGLYVLCLALFIYGCLSMVIELHDYNRVSEI